MFCTHCGSKFDARARFCSGCGAAREGASASPPPPVTGAFGPRGQLVRSRSSRAIAGVCGGFAEHYGWDLTLVRVLTVVITALTIVTVFAYIAAWIIIPDGQYALPMSVAPPPPAPGAAESVSI